MGNTNYPIGSKPNPVSWASYNQDVNNNNWAHPAWVESDEGNKFLADSNGEAVSCTGSYGSPYTGSMFQQLYSAGCWSGGWVNDEDEIIYISSNNTRYPAIEDEIFGSEDNPIPEDIYEEMWDNEIWSGGWVIDSNNNVDFVDGNDSPNGEDLGSGDEEGCGCDEGCGCTNDNDCPEYLVQGGFYVQSCGPISGAVESITIVWTEGIAAPMGLGSGSGSAVDGFESEITISPEIIRTGYYIVPGTWNDNSTWKSPYTIKIDVDYEYYIGINTDETYHGSIKDMEYGIPDIYKEVFDTGEN